MNRTLTLWAALSLLQGFAAATPVSIPAGGLVYSQNFNSLPTAANNGTATTAWKDDGTLPGWWLYRAGNGTPPGFAGDAFSYRVGDGTVAPSLGQFYSMGAAGNADRALGAPSTTAQGGLSAMVVFQNNSGTTVELTRVKHRVEVLRANDGANNVETIFVWTRTAASLAEIKAMTTAPVDSTVFSPGVSTGPTSHYVTGWDRLQQAEMPYSNPVASQVVNVSNPVDVPLSPGIRVAPGGFFSIRYGNINDAGADALMGIDDVELTFTPITAAFDVAVSEATRQDSGTPLDPLDDTVDFTLTATGVGNVSPEGWIIQYPAVLAGETGDYNVPRRITGVPLSEFSSPEHTLDFYIEDQNDPALWKILPVSAPWCELSATVTGVTRDDRGSPDYFFDDVWGYSVRVDARFGGSGFRSDNSYFLEGSYGTTYTITGLPIAIGAETSTFTDNLDSLCSTSVTAYAPRILGTENLGSPAPLFSGEGGVPAGWVLDESLFTQTMTNGGGAPAKTYRSSVIAVAGSGGARFSANVRAVDTSSGFEAGDTLSVQLIIDGTTTVNLLTSYDTNRNGVMNGGTGAADDEFNAAKAADGSYTSNFPVSYTIPAAAGSVQLVVSGTTDSENETIIIGSILIETGGDTDGDGMTDIYEGGNGLDKNSAADRELDRDGDGQSNVSEFLAGTAANSAASVLRISGQQLTGGNLSVTWHSVPGRIYRVEFSPDLNTWTDEGSDFPAAPGSQSTAVLPLPLPAPSSYYLRVRVK